MAAKGLCGVWGLAMALIVRCTSACEMHLRGLRRGGVSASGLQRVALCSSQRPGPDGRDAGGVSESSGSGVEHPAPQSPGPSTAEPPTPRVSATSLRILRSLPASELLLVFFFYLRLLCPRLRIRETSEKPTMMQTHEGLFTTASLCPSIPDRAEQGLGP